MKRHFGAFAAILILCAVASADTIWLKSGVSIVADKVAIKGEVIEYVVGATKYSLKKSDVERIEPNASFGVSIGAGTPTRPQSPVPPSAASAATVAPAKSGHRSASVEELSRGLHPPEPPLSNESALLSRILNLDRVDDHALSEIEREAKPRQSAAAYVVAARYELKQNNIEKARVYARRALDFVPDSVPLLCWYSAISLQDGQQAEAVSRAERAVQLAPRSPDALRILGFAYYESNRLGDAARTWKLSLQLVPDEVLQRYLEKAERESAVEDSFNEQGTAHFTLLYQGRQTGFGLAAELTTTLERQYRELAQALGSEPQSNVTVILYTEKEFFDVTEAPSWAGGLNDGKLRIPVRNVSAMTPELARILKHELSHSFVHSITGGRCPRWMDEGIAQMMEPRDSAVYGRDLAQVFREGKQLPLRSLEGSFGRLTPVQAMVAYIESLAAMEYVRSTYGIGGVRKLLATVAEGERGEDVVRAVTQRNYSEFEAEIGSYLAKTYEGH